MIKLHAPKLLVLALLTVQLAFAAPRQVLAAASAQAKVVTLQHDIHALQYASDRMLTDKAHVLLKELNFEQKGQLSGSVSGQMESTNRFGSAAIGAVIGTTLMYLLSGVAPYIGLPLSLAAPLEGAAVGGGLGLMIPEKVGSGSLQGQIQGEVRSQGWDNFYNPKSYVLLVIDPAQISTIESLEREYRSDRCVGKYKTALRNLVQGKRYFTVEELGVFLRNIAEINRLLYDLAAASIDRSPAERVGIEAFMNRTNEWLAKKINVAGIGTTGLQVQPFDSLRVSFSDKLGWYENVAKSQMAVRPKPVDAVFVPVDTKSKDVLEKAISALRAGQRQREIANAKRTGKTSDLQYPAKLVAMRAGADAGWLDLEKADVVDYQQAKVHLRGWWESTFDIAPHVIRVRSLSFASSAPLACDPGNANDLEKEMRDAVTQASMSTELLLKSVSSGLTEDLMAKIQPLKVGAVKVPRPTIQ